MQPVLAPQSTGGALVIIKEYAWMQALGVPMVPVEEAVGCNLQRQCYRAGWPCIVSLWALFSSQLLQTSGCRVQPHVPLFLVILELCVRLVIHVIA